MAEAFGAILSFLGAVLNAIYQVIPSYGVAIILLTIVVRLVLFPLGVKQIRSMTSMQKIQPKVKELQKKHKGDRQRLNEEMMKLYREHGVNPLGGCFPMLLQLPVFIALYAVIRSVVPFDAALAQPVKATIPITRNTICRPVGTPSTDAKAPVVTRVRCEEGTQSQEIDIDGDVRLHKSTKTMTGFPPYVTLCKLGTEKSGSDTLIHAIQCSSPLGTGHLPKDGKLFSALVNDRGTFVGMHLACSPTQATSKKSIRACTAQEGAGGGPALIAYFGLVVLMAGTTFYQQKQMQSRQPAGPQAQQMQMMTRIMPVFMGFLSLNFPAALSLYWVVGNFWMIGQQHFILKAQEPPDGATPAELDKGGRPASPNGGRPGKKDGGKPGRPGKSGKPGRSGRSGKRR